MSNSTSLTFHENTLDLIERKDGQWIMGTSICRALGYTRVDTVNKIYERNKEEFTTSMTRIIRMKTNGGEQKVRIFSLQGAHLLAMLAKTPIAQEFRKWVLSVLEEQGQLQAPTAVPDSVRYKRLIETQKAHCRESAAKVLDNIDTTAMTISAFKAIDTSREEGRWLINKLASDLAVGLNATKNTVLPFALSRSDYECLKTIQNHRDSMRSI